jgi:S1-C subfamily serine protease
MFDMEIIQTVDRLVREVIGVNAAIASESGGFEGIGFTIPAIWRSIFPRP